MIEGAKKGQPAPNIWYVCYTLRWNFGPSFPLKEGKLYDIIYIMPVGWPESAFLRFWFQLTTRFNGKCMLGDQDWLTLLSWMMPASFYQLPCAFNFITDMVNKQLIARYELWWGADISWVIWSVVEFLHSAALAGWSWGNRFGFWSQNHPQNLKPR